MQMDRTTSSRTARGSGCCLCFAFVLAAFASASPYWVWRYSYLSTNGFYAATTTIATGAYVVSSTSASVPCGWYSTCAVASQWNNIDDFNNTVCGPEFWDDFGRFGFCTGINGTLQTPSKLSAMQGLTVSTTVFLLIATICASAAPSAGGSKAGFLAGACSALALILSCAAFSVAASFDYYKTFHDGGRLPFVTSNSRCFNCVVLGDPITLYWGPGFWGMVVVVRSISVSLLLLTCHMILFVCDSLLTFFLPHKYCNSSSSRSSPRYRS